jgi:hypothetical protein
MSVTPSSANERSCAFVASSAIASTVLGNSCDRGLAGVECTLQLHVRRKRGVIHAILTRMRRDVAVVVSANECGDGGDAMGWCRVVKFAMLSNAKPG